MTKKDFLSVKETSEDIGFSESWVLKLAQRGRIKGAYKVAPRLWLIPSRWVNEKKTELAKQLAELKTTSYDESGRKAVSVKEAMEQSSVSRQYLISLLHDKKLDGYAESTPPKNRVQWWVYQDSLDDFIEKRKRATEAK